MINLEQFDIEKTFSGQQNSEKTNLKNTLEPTNSLEVYQKSHRKSWQSILMEKDNLIIGVCVAVTLVGIIGIGTKTIVDQKQQLREIQEKVAGVREVDADKKILAGDSISFDLKLKMPASFVFTKGKDIMPGFENRPAVTNKLLSQKSVGGTIFVGGIEVYISENDRLLSVSDYGQKIAKTIGEKAVVDPSIITTQNKQTLKKIVDPTTKNLEYYVGVTENNYYFIKVNKSLSDFPDTGAETQFINTLISSIYIN
jgi:hypothetical protein